MQALTETINNVIKAKYAANSRLDVLENTPTRRLNNLKAVTAPTATDDSSSGYSTGSVWVDVVTSEVYICSGNSAGAAVWALVVSGGAIAGSIRYKSVTGSYAILVTDFDIGGKLVVYANSATAITVTYPVLSTAKTTTITTEIVIKNINTGAVAPRGSGSETIDGVISQVALSQYEALSVVAGPSEWSII